MSLVIYVSHKTVIISKYNQEFRFSPPPQNLTKAAIGSYQLLRQSEILQTESSRDQKDEVITLLKQYGLALFQAVVPESHRSQVYKAGGIFIYSLDKDILDLPWELLFDGSSFFALTQGIIRISKANTDPAALSSFYQFPSLRLSLNSYTPLEQQKIGPRFCAHIEELAAQAVPRSPLIDLQFNGNASKQSIIAALNAYPNIFFFSGHDSEEGWILDDTTDFPRNQNWLETTLKPHLIQAVKNGLKIAVLQTPFLLEQPKNSLYHPQKFFFDCGVPFVISIHGRLARERLTEYMNVFFLSLLREESISRAHRLAINHIQSSLPLSWDWSWIRFNINQALLESSSEQMLPPFHFVRRPDDAAPPAIRDVQFEKALPGRRFYGNPEVLRELSDLLRTKARTHIICLNPANGQPVETYIGECLRRQLATSPITLATFYYQRWGFGQTLKSRIQSSKFTQLFSFLTHEHCQQNDFDKSQIFITSTKKTVPTLKVMLVYTPPSIEDMEFDLWLTRKHQEGWQIIVIHDRKFPTTLKTTALTLGKIQQLQVINHFEDGLPERWIGLLENNSRECLSDLNLLKMIHKSGNDELIALLEESPSLDSLYQASFQAILPSLSATRFKLFICLYLFRMICPKTLLISLFGSKGTESDLNYLFGTYLIDSNLAGDHFWIPAHVRQKLDRLGLIPENTLRNMGQELLQQLIAQQDDDISNLNYLEVAFQYCLMHLVENGDLEYPLQRNLQFGKKLSRKYQTASRYAQNILTSMELALHAGKGELIQKTLFSLVEILEALPFENDTISLCDWLLAIEKKHRNWPLVAEIQTRMASIYAALNKKEKAIGLISSALKLNNDIKNFSSRYQNLISIALLLLDLGEFEKLSKLLTTANFDISLLNKEDIAKLWLIDGHMLYRSKRYNEAETSFKKVIDQTTLAISESLMAKTLLYLAEICQNKGDFKAYHQHLGAAARLIHASGDAEKAAEIQEDLYESAVSQNDIQQAVTHLEWIYRFHLEQGNKTQARQAADLLGGLYFKIGEQAKSTEFYSIAQGI